MRTEVSGPPLSGPATAEHLLASVERWAVEHPEQPMLSVREGGHYRNRSAAQVWQRVLALGRGLIATGIESGDRVGLLSATRAEWVELDLAINAVGAVTVPIYETASTEQIHWILSDSGAVLLVTESAARQADAQSVADETACREVLAIDGGGLDDLVQRGHDLPEDAVELRLRALTGDDLSTVVYTSGTTGRPKGCVLTHRNLQMNVDQTDDALAGAIGPADTVLLFLPLAHILTKTTALFCLAKGVTIAFATSIATLPDDFAAARPTLIASVPRIFEKVVAKAQQTAEGQGRRRLFDRATATAIRFSRQRAAGHVTWATRAEHQLFDRLLYRKLSAAFGGQLRLAFSGGAPLGERLTSFFDGIGIRIYEGYGLTETSPLLTINRTDGWRAGSVGRAVADTSIMIGDDGEVLVKGPQVFRGYWHNDAATAEVFDEDGWFHTGDIGTLDDDGYLWITGRKKDLIVTSAGKNVAPAPLEDQIRSHHLVSQAMVVGDGQRFVAALITIDEEAFADWAEDNDHQGVTVAELASSEVLREEIQVAVDRANASVSRAEAVRQFVILTTDFSLERNEITPTLKVRRAVVAANHEDTIDAIYREPSST